MAKIKLEGYLNHPYWWDSGPANSPLKLDQLSAGVGQLPAQDDCVIVGAGYTGLSAALTLARAGRSVSILDLSHPGYGCSARNGGLIGPSFHKLGLNGLKARLGQDKANAIIKESMDILLWLKRFIADENIECGLIEAGRFRGAVAEKNYGELARQAEQIQKVVDLDFEMVPKAKQRDHIGSDYYQGGIVYQQDGHLHPGLYLKGLANKAIDSGVKIFAPAEVTDINKTHDGYAVDVGNHTIRCGEVLVATNGYTGASFPYLQRRIIPIRSAIIATEPLSKTLMQELSPQKRGFGDTSRLVPYYRPSPDGSRLIFGGRAFSRADRPGQYSQDLHRLMTRIFPQLRQTQITHAWSGTVAYGFDHSPHIGQIPDGQMEGVYYSMGYCGSGVGRASWYGRQAALKILKDPEATTALDSLAFETRPFYSGTPWFLPAILRWHNLMDRMGY